MTDDFTKCSNNNLIILWMINIGAELTICGSNYGQFKTWLSEPGLFKCRNLSYLKVWKYHLIIIHKDCSTKTTIYMMTTIIKHQLCAFVMGIIFNLELGFRGWVLLNRKCPAKMNEQKLRIWYLALKAGFY